MALYGAKADRRGTYRFFEPSFRSPKRPALLACSANGSSLSYLRNFLFDKIEIDKSFIQDIANGAEPLTFVHAVAGLVN